MVVNKAPTILSINDDCDKIRCKKIDIFFFASYISVAPLKKLEKKYGTLPLNDFTVRNYLMKVL